MDYNRYFPKRGEVWYADLGGEIGRRPILIVQNNIGNLYSPNVVCVALTTNLKRRSMPTHVVLPKRLGLPKESLVKGEFIFSMRKYKLCERMCTLTEREMEKVENAILIELGISINQSRFKVGGMKRVQETVY